MATNFFADLKGPDWINLANMGTNLVAGLAQGAAASRQAGESAQEFALRQQQELYRQAQDAYARRLAARSGIGAALQDQTLARRDAAQSTLTASPLGAEQALVASMARARGLSNAAENFKPLTPTDPRIAGAIRPTSNILGAFTGADYRSAISPEATARSIAERRKAIAGANPDFQFGSMGDYGLPSGFDAEVTGASNRAAADRLGRENQLMQLLTSQMEEASKPLYGFDPSVGNVAPATNQPKKEEGTPWWKKALKIASVAAPFALAPFTGGLSLGAQAAIGAGIGAAGQLGSGGGLKDAIIGGSLGAGTGFLNGKLNQGSKAPEWQGPVYNGPSGGAQPVIPPAASYLDEIMKQAATNGQFAPQQPARGAVTQPTFGIGMQPQQPVSRSQQAQTVQPPMQSTISPMRPVASPAAPATAAPAGMSPALGANRPTVMRAPTPYESFRDAVSPIADFFSGLGAPGIGALSTTQPYSSSPLAQGQPNAFTQVQRTPVGAAILGSLAVPNAAAGGGQQLLGPGATPNAKLLNPGAVQPRLTGVQQAQLPAGRPPLGLPAGQYQMPGPRTFNLPPSMNGSGDHQAVIAKLLEAMQVHRNDPKAMQQLINMMQPYLQRIP